MGSFISWSLVARERTPHPGVPTKASQLVQRHTILELLRGGEGVVTKKSAGTDSGQTGIGHPHIDARSLDMARIVVERIDADPSLLNVANENLERWRQLHGTLSRANQEWEQILERPWRETREILLDESDEGQRLRSSHPFRGIVTEEERLEIMRRHPPPWPHRAVRSRHDPARGHGEDPVRRHARLL